MSPLKIIFAGTPDFSVAPLLALLKSKHQVVGVYTQPDRPAGRGRKLTASPIKTIALKYNLAIFQPENLKGSDTQQQMLDLNADVMVVVAYGLILPKTILEIPHYGCLNIHASLLPRWRGAAPLQRAIESGDTRSGVTIMQMDIGLDTGDMLYKVETPITQNDNTTTLHDRLSTLGADALIQTLKLLQSQNLMPKKQDQSLAIYAHKLSKAEAKINWTESAETIIRKIRAFNPWPIAFTHFKGKPLRINQARLLTAAEAEITNENTPGLVISIKKQGIIIGTGIQPILIQQVQPFGKRIMPAYDFAQSRQLQEFSFV